MRRKTTLVGIEITESHINVATVRRKGQGIALERWGSAELPDATVQDGLIIERKRFAAALRRLLKESGIRARSAVVSISAVPVMTRLIRLPPMEPEEMREAIAAEVGKYVAFAGEETVFDFLPLEVTPEAEEMQDVLVSVTTKEIASACAEAVGAARLEVRALETSFLASLRAAYAGPGLEAEAASIFARIGTTATDVSIVEEARIIFSRRIPIGIAGLAKAAEELSGELKKVMDFYRSRPTPREKLKLIISPKNETTKNLSERMVESARNLEVELLDASEKFGARGGKGGEPPLAAIGSAMREVPGLALPVEMNLLPEETMEERRISRELLVTVDILAVLFVGSFFALGGLRWKAENLTASMSSVNQQLEESASLRRELEGFKSRIRALGSEVKLYEEMAEKTKGATWSTFLLELRRIIPKDVRIIRLSSDSLGRTTLGGEAISYESVSRFVKMLEESELVESAQLSLAKKGSRGLIDYSISCTLKAGER